MFQQPTAHHHLPLCHVVSLLEFSMIFYVFLTSSSSSWKKFLKITPLHVQFSLGISQFLPMNQDTHPPDSSSSLPTIVGASESHHLEHEMILSEPWISWIWEFGYPKFFSKLRLVAVPRLLAVNNLSKNSSTTFNNYPSQAHHVPCRGLNPPAPASQVPRCSWRGRRSIPQNHLSTFKFPGDLEIFEFNSKTIKIQWNTVE